MTNNPHSTSIAFISDAIGGALHGSQNASSGTPYLLLGLAIIATGFILYFAHAKIWARFATAHIWKSRIALCLISLLLGYVAFQTGSWAGTLPKGFINLENPPTTSTSMKLGEFRILYMQQAVNTVGAEHRDTLNCMQALAKHEAEQLLAHCNDEEHCTFEIAPRSREELIQKIKFIQSHPDNAATELAPCFTARITEQ